MDYDQHMYGRPSYDPTHVRGSIHREGGGVGSIVLLVGAMVAVLALVIMMSDGQSTAPATPTTPAADAARAATE